MKQTVINLALVSLMFSAVSFSAHAQTTIAVVNTERLLKESVPAQDAQKALASEFSKRESVLLESAKELKSKGDKLEREASVLSSSERSRLQTELADADAKFQRERRNLEEEVQSRRSQLLASILERAQREVVRVAEAEKIDLVLQEAVWNNPKIDITSKVLEALKTK
jgi:outer membrane protein